MLILISIPLDAQILTNVDFGSVSGSIPRVRCAVTNFAIPDTDDYTVTVSVAGMVFDQAREYSLQLSSVSSVVKTISVSDTNHWGLYHSEWAGTTPPVTWGEIDKIDDTYIGGGVYDIRFQSGSYDLTVHLDLTDGKWAEGIDLRNIIFHPEDGDPDEVGVYISSHDPDEDSTRLLFCGYFLDGSVIKYWYLVRDQEPTYARDRDDFSIDPDYTGPDLNGDQNSMDIPYGVDMARLDVHVRVRDNIRIPAGKTWRVTTCSDPLLQIEETFIMFAEGKGLTVRDKGVLISTHSGPYGVTDWFCYESTDKGAWTGIVGERGSTIDMASAHVNTAVNGLHVNRSAVTLDVVLIDSSRDRGLHIINCSPEVTASLITNTGGEVSQERGINVYISGGLAAPVFRSTGITRARTNYPYAGGPEAGGHGVELFAADTALFDNCIVRANDSSGYYIHDTRGPYILSNRIDSNRVGVFIERGSYWTTLRESRVFGNTRSGISMTGVNNDTARIRGWYPPFEWINPNTPSHVDMISDVRGYNCIYENYENIRAQSVSRIDFGALYYNGGGVQVPLGHINSIFDPVTPYQVVLANSSIGGFQRNWWNGQNQLGIHFSVDGSSSMDAGNELAADSIGCSIMGKSVVDEAGSLTRDILLYRRTRGSMRLPQTHVEAGMEAAPAPVARRMLLGAPYPNPFNPVTTVTVTLFEGQDLRLFVTDALGRQVRSLASGHYDAGRYALSFHAGSLPSGVYHLVLHGSDGMQSRRIVLAK
jgi:hypothetical protein